ncbi:putative ferredoxin-like protein YdhX precursor [Posidoniimonas corsicana]|uniref:Putative ferredoxin-like protein YdhX n=2 Tax=Posidoniimonas corsicana TaxID=1938618 RepID=A0A5C5UYU9_9BACT|nr:putative ferredoxin-like protein YdhX precursor [Posidoniimonas corsicana]
MDDRVVDRLLGVPPFRAMDHAAFPDRLPLRSLLANDTRVLNFKQGDLIIREGEYGDSAYLMLHGAGRIALDALEEVADNAPQKKSGRLARAVARLWNAPLAREVRSRPRGERSARRLGVRGSGDHPTFFLQDIPRVISDCYTLPIQPGEVFGELGALTRSPRSASVFAESDSVVLEIRWQGLRDLMRYSPEMKRHVERAYRENSLRVHLRETPLLAHLSEEQLAEVANATQFVTHGAFDWHSELLAEKPGDLFARVEREPVVAEEGTLPEGLLLLRSGFGRVSQRRGDGHQTVLYIGKGAVFGACALAHGVRTGQTPTLPLSLRAVGYLDVLLIPTRVFQEVIAPALPAEELDALVKQYERQHCAAETGLPARTLDFLVDRRLVNGEQTMVIDLDRCTRCDDCVRACAATHDGNPRFVRQGPIHDHFQYANACMHCVDPVCMIGCPTGAIHRDLESGVVKINDPTCIGCSTCANSCPYHNIRMVEARTPAGAVLSDDAGLPIIKATKCDLCGDQPTGPACQHACPHDALTRVSVAAGAPLAEFLGADTPAAPSGGTA